MFRHTATRMTVSIGVAVLVVMATAVPTPASTVSPAVRLAASTACRARPDDCALIMGATTIPTPNDFYIDAHQEPVHCADPSEPGHRLRRGDHARGVVAPHGLLRLLLGSRSGTPSSGRAWWPSVAGRAVVETLGALRPHLRSVDPGRGRRSGDGDGRVRQRPSGDLRLLPRRGHRELEKQRLAEQYPGEPMPPISTSWWAVTPISPTGAYSPGSRAFTSRSSICRSTAPRRPTPSSTPTSSSVSTMAWRISRCIRSTSSPT